MTWMAVTTVRASNTSPAAPATPPISPESAGVAAGMLPSSTSDRSRVVAVRLRIAPRANMPVNTTPTAVSSPTRRLPVLQRDQ